MVVRKRLNLTGPAVAFVTTAVYEWQPVLTQPDIISIIIEEINNSRECFQLSVLGYVIMPSHLHLLIGFPVIENLSKCIQAFKSIASRRVKSLALSELAGNGYRLWRPRFDDLIIVSEEQFRIKLDYIHNNPVEAGLTAEAAEWPWSSAQDWQLGEAGPVPVDKGGEWLKE